MPAAGVEPTTFRRQVSTLTVKPPWPKHNVGHSIFLHYSAFRYKISPRTSVEITIFKRSYCCCGCRCCFCCCRCCSCCCRGSKSKWPKSFIVKREVFIAERNLMFFSIIATKGWIKAIVEIFLSLKIFTKINPWWCDLLPSGTFAVRQLRSKNEFSSSIVSAAQLITRLVGGGGEGG